MTAILNCPFMTSPCHPLTDHQQEVRTALRFHAGAGGMAQGLRANVLSEELSSVPSNHKDELILLISTGIHPRLHIHIIKNKSLKRKNKISCCPELQKRPPKLQTGLEEQVWGACDSSATEPSPGPENMNQSDWLLFTGSKRSCVQQASLPPLPG